MVLYYFTETVLHSRYLSAILTGGCVNASRCQVVIHLVFNFYEHACLFHYLLDSGTSLCVVTDVFVTACVLQLVADAREIRSLLFLFCCMFFFLCGLIDVFQSRTYNNSQLIQCLVESYLFLYNELLLVSGHRGETRQRLNVLG